MRLYHGSTVEIDSIDLGLSRPNKDFGRAFYLSADYEQALAMAQFKAEFENVDPIVTAFDFDEANLARLRYLSFDGYTAEWAHFVYENRTEPHGMAAHDYDIVYGPIANDRIGAQIARYRQGYISFDDFINRIRYMKGITFQYAFCTQKAIEGLVKA